MRAAHKVKSRRALGIALMLFAVTFNVCCSRRPSPAAPQRINLTDVFVGRVVRIADGDTVTLLDSLNVQHHIRLQGIDAPESHQAFGQQSKKNLSAMIFDKQVTAACDKTDQYGRQVCKIICDGNDINLEQIKAGMAWHYKEYEREQSPADREIYAHAENEARQAGRGLWSEANAVAPSEYRREEKREREAR